MEGCSAGREGARLRGAGSARPRQAGVVRERGRPRPSRARTASLRTPGRYGTHVSWVTDYDCASSNLSERFSLLIISNDLCTCLHDYTQGLQCVFINVLVVPSLLF